MKPTDDKIPCPKCGYESSNTNIEDEDELTNTRTYRCGKCENVFNTVERIIPGTIRPPDDPDKFPNKLF